MMNDEAYNEAYNSRQWKLLREVIALYRAGRCPLERLIGQVEGLISALKLLDAGLREKLGQAAGMLEDVHAVALDCGELVSDSDPFIEQALTTLDMCAEDALKRT